MNKDTLITKQDLMLWLDRMVTAGDIDDMDLCEYLANAVKNQYEYKQKINELNKIIELPAVDHITRSQNTIKNTKKYHNKKIND